MQTESMDIAIVGMSLNLPDAVTQEEFYENLKNGRDSLGTPPSDRLKHAGIDPTKDYKIGAYINRLDLFDHKYFNIGKKEAEFMDPTQRILLELAVEAIENAGYSPKAFKNSNTALYICSNVMFGLTYQAKVAAVHTAPDPTIHTGGLNSMICGRIAYCLGLTGPAVMVDTGCSSSLIALNEAVEKLQNKRVDAAMVGGLVLKPMAIPLDDKSNLGASSETGKSRAFAADADGIGVGEGGGLILIKRLEDALRDKDPIQAVIKGIGVSQDGGRCNSIAAPSPVAQTQAIKEAWTRANVDPRSINFIETHGAGTHLGDVIEVQALTDAYSELGTDEKFCALGAVKTNIGHVGNTAGMAGLIKAVIGLKRKELFPVLHFKEANPFIDFDKTNIYVNTTHKSWPTVGDEPLRCGVSSFGLSGTNAHLILEEAPERGENKSDKLTSDMEHIIKISARSLTAFEANKEKVLHYLKTTNNDIQDIMYTLNLGREDAKYRRVFYGKNKEDLLVELENFNTNTTELKPFKQKERQVVVLLSSGHYDIPRVKKLCETFPVINSCMNEVLACSNQTALAGQVETFAFHYGLYKQIEQMGISVKTIIGSGLGSKLAPVIAGKISLKEMVNSLEGAEVESNQIDEDKLKQIVKTLIAKDAPVFIDLGAHQSLAEMLTQWSTSMSTLTAPFALDMAHDQPIEKLFSQCYNEGVNVDWATYYSSVPASRVEAPTYSFDKIRCWFEDSFEVDENYVQDFMYEYTWQAHGTISKSNQLKEQSILVFDGNEGLGNLLQSKLNSEGNNCILVTNGDTFMKLGSCHYQINYQQEEEYLLLRDVLSAESQSITGIVHLGNYAPPNELNMSNHQAWMDESFIPQYLMARVFAEFFLKPGFQLALLTANGQLVLDEDKVIPFHGLSCTFVKGLLAEFTSLKVTYLDVKFEACKKEELTDILLGEMSKEDLLRFSALRDGTRYVPQFSKLTHDTQQQKFKFESGAYLVTGGCSGLGLETCKAIAQSTRSSLYIIGRTELPPQTEWPSIISLGEDENLDKILAMIELQKLGAEVTYFSGDVADGQRMGEIIDCIRQATSELAGVIHSAGVGNTGTPIADREVESMRKTTSPKIAGSIIVEELTRNFGRKYFLSFSSIATIVPSRGGLDYACANGFEDCYAEALRSDDNIIKIINWSDWKETGLAYRKRLKRSISEVGEREQKVRGLSNEEGLTAIKYTLASSKSQLAVANIDLSFFAINPYFKTLFEADSVEVKEVKTEEVSADSNHEPTSEVKLLNGEVANETERQLIAIWHEVLKLDTIQLDDDFYDLGGHSLNITLMLNKVEKVFGVSLEMDVLLEDSSIRSLAAVIDSRLGEGKSNETKGIVPLAKQDYYDVSHAQKRFWILSQQKGKEAYNVPAAFFFTGTLDVEALEEGFKDVVARHECLRTTFHLVDGTPKQKIRSMEEISFGIDLEDLQAEPDPTATAKLRLKSEAALPFDLENDVMLRLKLFKLGQDQFLFFMNMHHIVADATSIAVLRKEALTNYKRRINREDKALPPLQIQYKDFAAWQNNLLTGGNLLNHENYWSDRLKGISPKVDLPTDGVQAGNNGAGSADKVRIQLSKEEMQAIEKLAKRANTTLFNTVLAFFNMLLYKYSTNKFITVGTPVSGRENELLQDQIGIYLNTLLLRTEIDEDSSFYSLLETVRDNMFRDLSHQQYPYDLLTEELFDNDPANSFNVGFTWTVRQILQETIDLDFEIEDVSTGFNQAKNDLWLFGVAMEESLILEFLYKTSLFDEETIELMAARLKHLITQFVENPDELIKHADFSLASSDQESSSALNIAFNF